MAYRRIGITRRNEDVVDAAGGQATDDLAWMSLGHDRACRDMGARPDTRAGSVAPRAGGRVDPFSRGRGDRHGDFSRHEHHLLDRVSRDGLEAGMRVQGRGCPQPGAHPDRLGRSSRETGLVTKTTVAAGARSVA